MPARIVTFLPQFLKILSTLCRYMGRYDMQIKQRFASDPPTLAKYQILRDACDNFIQPLDDLVNPR